MKDRTSLNSPSKRLYSVLEASIYLGRTVNAIRAMQWSGKLPHVNQDRRIYFDVYNLDSLIKKNKVVERE